MSTNELKYPLADVKKVIRKWLYLESEEVIDVILAVYVANRFEADPIWLIIIAPPSSTKTELLRSFDGHKNAFFLSNLTPSTLVSGADSKKGEPSLLPKLNNKLVVLKDFTSILSMRSENQQEILAQLREAYDGSYVKSFGTGKIFTWKGRFGLIAACTPVYDCHYGVIGSMGERFLLYRISGGSNEKMGLQAQRIVGKENEMRAEIRGAVHRFIDQFNKLGDLHFEKDGLINHQIIKLATFCAYGRCPVERDYRDRHVKYQPLPEGSARLVKQFMQMGMGLALVHGKNLIDEDIYEIIKKIGRDLIPAQRLAILKHLWDNRVFEYMNEWEKTKAIADAISMPVNTTKLILEDLMIVGLLNRERADEGETSPYMWQFGEKTTDLLAGAEAFNIQENEAVNAEKA